MVLAAAWVVVPAATAHADRLVLGAGGEATATPGLGGYGWAFLRHEREGRLPHGARLSVEYNSDTLRVTIDRARYDHVELAVSAYGEALLAGVLHDYVRDGRDDRARGFFASYLGAAAGAKVDLGAHFLELVLGARRWFFARHPATDPALVLPPDAWVGEARLYYTFWRLLPDPSLWEPQRLWWRVRGVAAGVELSADLRSDVARWGASGPAFFPADPRNDPSRAIFGAVQWLRAGAQLHPRVRLQLREEGRFMWGEDDLVRARIGGMNPWSVPLAGAAWGGYLSGRFLAGEGSIHVRVRGEHEVGALVDAVLLDDVRRVGDHEAHVLYGVGAFADLRFRRTQLDLRGGWSPTVQPGRFAGGFSLLAAAGWTLR